MNKELLLVVESVSNEKSIPQESIFKALEHAVALALKKKLPCPDALIRVHCDRKDGKFHTFQKYKVVEKVINPNTEISVEATSLPLGDFFEKALEAQAFDRITTQAAKQVIIQKVREAERQSIVEQFKHHLKKLVSGVVKEVGKDFVTVDLGWKSEAVLPRLRMLPKENFRAGDRVRAILYETQWESPGPLFYLSRICDEMVIQLLRLEVPEIQEGTIEIKGLAREPGMRAKLAVQSKDKRIDPIGACVGMRGSRIQSVSLELRGERIDIVIWDENPVQYVINAMSPTAVTSIIMDEDLFCMDVAVLEAELSQAIGKNGHNVKLASQLTGWKLNVLDEKEFLQQKENEQHLLTENLKNSLHVSQKVAEALLEEGYVSVEEIAGAALEEIESNETLNVELLKNLKQEAQRQLISKKNESIEMLVNFLKKLEMDAWGIPSFSIEALAERLIEHNFETLEKIADASKDEMQEIDLGDEVAGKLIMAAREHCWAST